MDDINTPSNSAAALPPVQNQVVTHKKSRGIAGKLLMTFLLLAVLALGGAVYYLYESTKDLKTAVESVSAQSADTRGLLFAEKTMLRPAVDGKAGLVIIPELSIALPYNSVTKKLQYTAGEDNSEGGENKTITLTSTSVPDYEPQQMGCSELLFVSTEDAPLVNPWTESGGSVKLSNGTSLYLRVPKAFANNEGSTEYCTEAAWSQVSPQQLADEFKKAVSY